MAFCRFCGAQGVDQDSAFCPACGKPLRDGEAIPDAEAPAALTVPPATASPLRSPALGGLIAGLRPGAVTPADLVARGRFGALAAFPLVGGWLLASILLSAIITSAFDPIISGGGIGSSLGGVIDEIGLALAMALVSGLGLGVSLRASANVDLGMLGDVDGSASGGASIAAVIVLALIVLGILAWWGERRMARGVPLVGRAAVIRALTTAAIGCAVIFVGTTLAASTVASRAEGLFDTLASLAGSSFGDLLSRLPDELRSMIRVSADAGPDPAGLFLLFGTLAIGTLAGEGWISPGRDLRFGSDPRTTNVGAAVLGSVAAFAWVLLVTAIGIVVANPNGLLDGGDLLGILIALPNLAAIGLSVANGFGLRLIGPDGSSPTVWLTDASGILLPVGIAAAVVAVLLAGTVAGIVQRRRGIAPTPVGYLAIAAICFGIAWLAGLIAAPSFHASYMASTSFSTERQGDSWFWRIGIEQGATCLLGVAGALAGGWLGWTGAFDGIKAWRAPRPGVASVPAPAVAPRVPVVAPTPPEPRAERTPPAPVAPSRVAGPSHAAPPAAYDPGEGRPPGAPAPSRRALPSEWKP